LGTAISLKPFVAMINKERRAPAVKNLMPILRSGGIVSITYAMAKYVDPQMM
jgi:hypothetical protein